VIASVGKIKEMVIVFPVPEVFNSPLPRISRSFTKGIAVPSSVVYDVAI